MAAVKFIFFSAQYLPTVGGVERYTNSLAKQLIALGHSAVVVTSALENLPFEETDKDGIKIYRLPVKWLLDKRFPVIIPNSVFRSLKSKIKAEKADFAVIQTRFYINSLFGAKLCKGCNIPAIVVDHSTSHLINGGLSGYLGGLYEHFAAAYLKSRVGCFYGVSQKCCQWLSHFNIKTDKVLYNCTDLETITNIPSATKEAYGISQDSTVVVFAARLVKEKGVLKLIEAFQNILLSKENLCLVIAGTGELYSTVKAVENDRIKVVGSLSFENAIGLYKMADIFCLPTDYPEGFPTTVLEATACHTMVIASDRGGTKEIIINDDYGIVLSQNTVKNLQAALQKAIDDKAYRQKCVQNSYSLLQKSFVWQSCCHKLIDIAQHTIDSGR